MALIYFLLGGFLRRWYGGLFPDDEYKIISNRGLQTGFMIGLFLTIYITDWQDWKNILLAVAISCWLQFQFWSRGHGVCFDQSRGGYPDAETLKRYNERWCHIPCDWLADKGFFSYYGWGYDFTYMFLRYACPMLPMMFFDWKYVLIGAAISPIYAVCWQWYESRVWCFNFWGCKTATNLAEILSGGLVYAGCYLLGAL